MANAVCELIWVFAVQLRMKGPFPYIGIVMCKALVSMVTSLKLRSTGPSEVRSYAYFCFNRAS